MVANRATIVILFIFMSTIELIKSENERPIIGILSQEVSNYVKKYYPDEHSYIAASYVKFLEGAGARVVPIWIGQTMKYYTNIMGQINGILLPGGKTKFDAPDGYGDAAWKIYNIAKEMNENGTHFPILGICLGFEVLIYAMTDRSETALRDCSALNKSLPLKLEPGYNTSKMFGKAPEIIINSLIYKNVTYNTHEKCVTKQILHDHGIANALRVLSTNKDDNGLKFISAFESIRYPFYGLQFHPEKNLYEWKKTKAIPHGKYASQISQYFANFIVDEARRNKNKFVNETTETKSLIYNYDATYTAPKNILFQQCYFFKKVESDHETSKPSTG